MKIRFEMKGIVCFCRIVMVEKFTKMKNKEKTNMGMSKKTVFTFVLLLGMSTCLLPNGVSTASQQNGNDMLPSFAANGVSDDSAVSYKGKAPFHVTFDSKKLVGAMESYTWNFGDGEMAQGPVASHTFITEGTYSVTLIAKENTGRVHKEELTVSVTSQQ